MKRFLLIAIVGLFFQSLFAEIPDGYYDTADGKEGYELKTALYNIIKGHTSVSYTPGVWNAFYTTDVRADGKVWDTYSDCNFTLGDDQDSGSGGSSECEFYNREHSFPKSWFSDASPMTTDIFHIMPTDKYVNGQRGNLEYGEVSSPTQTLINGSKIGPNTYGSFSGTVFEPIDEYKGDFARNYIYMATRYEDVISSWPGSGMLDGSSDQCFEDWALDMLIEWHADDPVSQKELDRNDAIYAIQDNRNPFIDHPEFVNIMYNIENTAPVIEDQEFTIAENSASGTVVDTIIATDSDYNDITFSILSGNTDDAFAIGASSGILTVNNTSALNYDVITIFDLIVEVSDGLSTSNATISVNVENVTGLSPISSNAEIKIYPNPAKEEINVDLENGTSINSIVVYNLIGEKVLEFNEVNSSFFTFNVEHLPKGFYFIQVEYLNEAYVQKIMLK
ncbi:MAG: endonuclease [Bacteroidales bacterium]|nr:endonuclease [Bacteroidales bacterium]